MRRLGFTVLLIMLGLPMAVEAKEYVKIGVYTNSSDSDPVRLLYEREGYSVEKRSVYTTDEGTKELMLIEVFDARDDNEIQLKNLLEVWKQRASIAAPEPKLIQVKEYVKVGVFPNTRDSQSLNARLVRDGFPVVERLLPAKNSRPADILMLIGPFDRHDQTVDALGKLRKVGRSFKEVLSYSNEPPPFSKGEAPPFEPTAPDQVLGLDLPPQPSTDTPAQSADTPMDVRLLGYVALDARYFREEPLYAGQVNSTASIALQPELYAAWNGGDSSLAFTPFVRAGDKDDERNHADIRELMWLNVFDDWELRLGIGRVYWGVTESQHLVDVINQTDLIENPDGEDKLGQPMFNLSHNSDWGTVDLFVLPGFRERTFAGLEGRLRGPLLIDSDQAQYESPDKDRHMDWAVRWSHYIGNLDIGLSHFSGTGRAPTLELGLNTQGQPVLIPRYDLLQQTGLSLQALSGSWTWKLETVSAVQLKKRHLAMTGGFEYTHVGLFGSQMDLGMLAEYLYDDRGISAPTPFANDLMVGVRWVINDVQSSEILVGMIHDMDGSANSINIEASRRLGQNWKLALEYRGNNVVEATDRLYPIRMDDYLQIELLHYF